MNNRCQTILSLLTEEQKIDVSEIKKKLQVSQVTIRKDLDELKTLLKSTFGKLR